MLKEIIDKFYLDKEKFRKGQTSFYISEAGKCSRQVFLKFKNAPKKDLEAAFLRLFDHGESMHKLIMKPLLATRDIHVVASEIDIPPQEIVRGRADAVLSDGKELFVLDIKSMNSMVFRNLKEPKEENVLQLQLYLHFFKIPKGILLYVDKDRLGLKEFLVNYNPATADQLISGLTVLKKQIEENTVPARILGYPSIWQCQYCQYLEVCKLGVGEEMKWEELKEGIEKANNK
ncbi:PD-(D/E)XK nuclease family protein [Patescibacteria group bacterium]|nr:PD-(D/E)XK nuclease family protein [Patescibacteria group bacterium]